MGSLSALVQLSLAPSLMRLGPVLLVVLTGNGRKREKSLLGLRALREGELAAAGEASVKSSKPACALLLCCSRDLLSGLRFSGLRQDGLLLRPVGLLQVGEVGPSPYELLDDMASCKCK
jgi:hypothetical protein